MTNVFVGLTASNTINGYDIYVRVPDNLDACYVMEAGLSKISRVRANTSFLSISMDPQ